jgi:ATP-binding cassette subfamily F protein uup
MDSPNVLLLDEPTNDFDIETLTELEDLLDSYGGTLIVISHDRYFLERVCDRFVGLMGDQVLRDLPRGVDEYLEHRAKSLNVSTQSTTGKVSNAAQERILKKDLTRVERQIQKAKEKVALLTQEQAEASFDAARLSEISNELAQLEKELIAREEEWLEITLKLEN